MSCHWGLLNADDLVVLAESKEELSKKLNRWKDGVQSKGMKVDMYKTNLLKLPLRLGGSGPPSNTLPSSLRTDSTDFTTGPSISVLCF